MPASSAAPAVSLRAPGRTPSRVISHRAMQDNIVLLEPWMRLEVTVPEEYLGPVNSDLMARRAEINKLENRNRLCLVEAHVPLRQVFDYADKVRSLSQGRASSTMEPYAY